MSSLFYKRIETAIQSSIGGLNIEYQNVAKISEKYIQLPDSQNSAYDRRIYNS